MRRSMEEKKQHHEEEAQVLSLDRLRLYEEMEEKKMEEKQQHKESKVLTLARWLYEKMGKQQQQHEEESKNYGTTSYDRRSEPSVRGPTSNEMSSIIYFSDVDIKGATNDLSGSRRKYGLSYSYDQIGIGGSRIYKGYLHDIEVAIKVFDEVDEYAQELEIFGRMKHPHFVKLIGACIKLHSLVYEDLPNGSVEDCLRKNPSILTWQMRTRIVYEICSALTFLHSSKPLPLVHGNINLSCILLDSSFRSKLANFGLFRLLSEGTTTDAFLQTTTIRGTRWYIDPDFVETALLTTACDLYSYGVTILRLLTGKPAREVLWEVNAYKDQDSLMRMVDPTAGNWPLHVSEHLAYLALKCCGKNGERKPGLTEEIMKELGDFLAATDILVNKEETFLLDLDKNSSILISSTSTSSIKAFSYLEIERATNGFSDKIGQGGYGSVYKGYLDNTQVVAIKMLDVTSKQGSEEFNQELGVLAQMRHPNLVELIGACFNKRSLVYEFLPNGSLEDCLEKSPRLLTWQIRTRIVHEICSGLIFLHSNKPQPLLHGDLKPANILLDDNFHIKLADFGLCRFLPEGTDTKKFHMTKNFKGTEWYIDPDYLAFGKISTGCDVYSFGVTILRILTRASPVYILRKVHRHYERKSLMTMVDSTAGAWPDHVADYLARIGLRSCDPEGSSRSELMMEILSDTKNILDKIGS